MRTVKIYKITNLINDMIYIGQTTKSLEERFKNHLKDAKHINESKTKPITLLPDLRELGGENFKIELITEALYCNRIIVENYYINYYYEKGYAVYNLLGLKKPNSRRQKIAEIRKNNGFDYYSDEFKKTVSSVTVGNKNGMYGKKGEKAINGQTVLAFDDDGELKHTFVSVREALKFCGVKGHISLNNAVVNGTKYKGYFWKKTWAKRA
ncbi:GIY-YIG nuclease family protein [Staphylococcus pseudintermedius]|nr:GIY-YIG nuclease family protein [Staphylococcus pseudintermedius]EJH4519897.1 GIY-YIG nuclease family protein [Staphylococcus pseudintermedius]